MTLKEMIKKSKELCENSNCKTCDLKDCACIDKHGHVNAADENELIAMAAYFEKSEKKGKKK